MVNEVPTARAAVSRISWKKGRNSCGKDFLTTSRFSAVVAIFTASFNRAATEPPYVPARHRETTERFPDQTQRATVVQGALTMKNFTRFMKDESGATAIEYGLIAACISVAIIAVVQGVGTALNTTFTSVSTALGG
jgi:pilus assembly protein Flp/PilA